MLQFETCCADMQFVSVMVSGPLYIILEAQVCYVS